MKHIGIISNYSGITEEIKSGNIAHNFLVKSTNDNKIHFSNNGYTVVQDGIVYNMYQIGTDSSDNTPIYEALIPASSGNSKFNFVITSPTGLLTANFDVSAAAWCNGNQTENYDEHNTGITTYTFDWGHETGGQVIFYVGQNTVSLVTQYYSTPEEDCGCAGGTWDPETEECTMPEPGPEEPCAGMEDVITDCEGRGGVWDYVNCLCNEPTPEPDPDACNGDPECECAGRGTDWTWDGESCVPVETE